jgi:hypothetical protein
MQNTQRLIKKMRKQYKVPLLHSLIRMSKRKTVGLCFALFLFAQQAAVADVENECEYLYICENAAVYGMEYLFVQRDSVQPIKHHPAKKRWNKKSVSAPVKQTACNYEAPKSIDLLSPSPFTPSSSFYFRYGVALAIVVPQTRLDEHPFEQTGAIHWGLSYLCKNPGLLTLYIAERRQKFSPTAIQCGILTSFGSNSPSLS